jgi:hypothetical protein
MFPTEHCTDCFVVFLGRSILINISEEFAALFFRFDFEPEEGESESLRNVCALNFDMI